jgi:hypothetical protein
MSMYLRPRSIYPVSPFQSFSSPSRKNTNTYTFKYATTDTLIIHTHFQFMITSVSFCYKGPGIKTE